MGSLEIGYHLDEVEHNLLTRLGLAVTEGNDLRG
jgi:hypothetical protein